MRDSVGVPIIVFTRNDEHLSTINNILRQAGTAAHCIQINTPTELEQTLGELTPELLLHLEDEKSIEISTLVARLSKMTPTPPLLLVRNKIDEQVIAEAMESGARDVVSLTHRNRFQSVVERELQAFRLQTALNSVVSSAQQYRQELRTLMDGTTEAIADIQEGIVIAANPTWVELFGYKNEADMIDMPFMDYCETDHHEMLKGAIVACLKQRWDEDSTLHLTGIHSDGSSFAADVRLERVSIDGDPAVRIMTISENADNGDTEDLLERALFKDPATGFFHRHCFIEKLDERLGTDVAGGMRAIVYIRPDSFARVHTDIGMLATEKLLTKLAGILKDFMQPNDLYGRFGGTMFIALLERGTMKDVETWAEQVRKTISGHVFEVEKQSTSLTCTLGAVEVCMHEHTTAQLLNEVEQACREGRDAGGNRVQLSEDTSATQAIRATDALWVPRLRDALMQNRLQLVHQPVTGLTEDAEEVYDTRLQMLDECGDTILASEFIPAAKRAGMIKNIDRWVIGASMSFCAANKPTLVFVRISDESLNDDALLEWLEARTKSTGTDTHRICFQVSEETAAQYLKQTKALSESLRTAGFKFAIDHLGTGRDSYQLLNHVPMDYTKIDGSLMQGLHREPGAQKTVGDLAQYAKTKDIKTIAERVEDANTMATLWQLGIGLIQGNYTEVQGVVLENTEIRESMSSSQ